ncbi:hypothetical protein NC652_037457 [Populus alba x Populus x berolinensis]|nr:hypothetical protein NC652_037457 [Populus alba x Populus x berolinensis]
MKQIREPGARGSYLKDSEKLEMYRLHKEIREVYTVEKLAKDYSIMRQRVHAILWLKEIEEKEEKKLGHPLDVSTKLLLDNFPEGDKAKDFAESNSSGVKYSVQAKVPATCVGKRGQLLPYKPDFKVMPEGCYGTIKDLEGVHYEISKEDEKLYQEYVQKMNFNKMKIGVRARSDVLWPLGMRLEMEVTLTREGDYPDDIWFSFVQMAGQVKCHKDSSGVLPRVGSSQWRNWGKKGGVVVVGGRLEEPGPFEDVMILEGNYGYPFARMKFFELLPFIEMLFLMT